MLCLMTPRIFLVLLLKSIDNAHDNASSWAGRYHAVPKFSFCRLFGVVLLLADPALKDKDVIAANY
jgi:hypothetical protein